VAAPPWPPAPGCGAWLARTTIEVLAGDRILEFLPQEALLDRASTLGRLRVRELPSVQLDRMHVLLAAKHQLFFFSRWMLCFQTGIATVIMTAMMLMATRSATMA
jgi:hypothetical protein